MAQLPAEGLLCLCPDCIVCIQPVFARQIKAGLTQSILDVDGEMRVDFSRSGSPFYSMADTAAVRGEPARILKRKSTVPSSSFWMRECLKKSLCTGSFPA